MYSRWTYANYGHHLSAIFRNNKKVNTTGKKTRIRPGNFEVCIIISIITTSTTDD